MSFGTATLFFIQFDNMKSFESFFTEENIITELAKIRSKEAKKRNDAYFYKKLNKYARDPSTMKAISGVEKYLPPRRKWKRLSKKRRKKLSSDQIQRTEIEKTVLFFKKNKINADWLIKLDSFINEVKKSALQQRYYSIKEPNIFGMPKGPESNRKFRPISSYSLKDRVIINLVAKYYQNNFDSIYLDSSYAFRAPKQFGNTLTHHDIITNIISYKKEVDAPLFVAEADIQKFFDTVHHQVAIESLYHIIDEFNREGHFIDSRAIHLYKSYLKSYTFYNSAKEYLENKLPNSEVPWPQDKLEEIYKDLKDENIGIPQGGALSPVIANIVMHRVDQKLQKYVDCCKLFYARYCDDMIILHHNSDTLNDALDIYNKSLQKLKLLPHDATEIGIYSSKFYSQKSKKPYLWEKPNKINRSPYISIVGYQIRYDLILRIKKDSVERELKKQVEVADRVLQAIKSPGINKSTKQILFRLTNKLLSMSVGKRKKSDKYDLKPMCWTSGFKKLKEHKHFKYQLKKLDRNRMRQISRIRNHLKEHNIKPVKPNNDIRHIDYFGPPFSYCKQFD